MSQQVVYSIISEDNYGGSTIFHRIFVSLDKAVSCAERLSQEQDVDYYLMRVIVDSDDDPVIIANSDDDSGIIVD